MLKFTIEKILELHDRERWLALIYTLEKIYNCTVSVNQATAERQISH